ncbi:MAG: hypothetical protein AABZ74_02030 [Cyanobacteriota bacterium]
MFNVYLVWNPDYIIKNFKSSLFDTVSHHYEFLEESNFILKITYTSKIPGLKINPVSVQHPRHNGNCLALFLMKGDELTNELIIDTRTTNYCDFVDYIRPTDGSISTTVSTDAVDFIQRQEKYWRWAQYFNKYVVDFSIKELENTYLISLTHGADVKIAYDVNEEHFKITKFNYRCIELMAYIKEYELPKMENIKVIYKI